MTTTPTKPAPGFYGWCPECGTHVRSNKVEPHPYEAGKWVHTRIVTIRRNTSPLRGPCNTTLTNTPKLSREYSDYFLRGARKNEVHLDYTTQRGPHAR